MITLGRRRSPVGLANEQVSIVKACQLVGMDLPDDIAYGRSIKVHCPFGDIYHADQGHEAALRIYVESNSAFCFAGCGHFTPVWLCAQAWDIDTTTAALDLLERAGIRPVSLADQWAQATEDTVLPDTTLLNEALKTFCRRLTPAWDDLQFEPGIAASLTRCLDLLDLVRTDADTQQWLQGCKQVMHAVLIRSAVYQPQSH